MILTDKDIKQRIEQGELILSGYCESNLNGVSYDLTVDSICSKEEKAASYELNPGETIFIKTKEQLSIPDTILGRIAEKNSRMRQGLKVDGPHYQPGHITYAFLRVQNLSSDILLIKSGMKIAQIIFEELTGVPERPYSVQEKASFQNEEEYRGLGSYAEEYEKQTKHILDKAKEDLEGISQRIYANVLTIMGILVAVFSLLSINSQAFSETEIDFRYILVMNLSLSLCIVIMMGIILVFVNKAKNKGFLYCYIAILAILAVATIVAAAVAF